MTGPVLITGGTGTLGRRLLPRLHDTGGKLRVLSRREHGNRDGVDHVTGDLTTGAGLAAAVDGIGTIVHCGGSARGDDEKTRNLVRVAYRAGVEHLVYISVVGADRVPVVSAVDRTMFGYFAAKRAAERVVAESGLPWTTLRATQFHESIAAVLRQVAKAPVMPVFAGVRFQPVSAGEVAARLAELALGPPVGLVPDLAGPRAYRMDELARGYLRAADKRRLILPIRVPGKAAAAVRAGANLTLDRAVGVQTWEDHLTTSVGDMVSLRERVGRRDAGS